MNKCAVAQLLGASMFQFYVTIVDPSVLAHPLVPGSPAIAPGAISTTASTATPQKLPSVQDSQGSAHRHRWRSPAEATQRMPMQ